MPDHAPTRPEEPTPWVRDGVWTVVDQALFAGANFAVNVMLARWLDPAGYGAYTVAYTVFLLLGTIHGGYLVEPMLVFGAGRFESRLERYLRLVLGGHARFSLAFAAVLIAGAWIAYLAGSVVLSMALAAFSVAQATILFQWTMRSACFVRTQPVLAAVSDGLYAVLMLAGVAALQVTASLNVATAVALVAVASLVAGVVTAVRLGVPLTARPDDDLERDAQEQHRSYGSWAAATGALEWFNGYLPVLLLPLWAGLAATGGLRALLNLVLPVLHATAALTKLLVPVFVRARDSAAQHRLALRVGGGMVAGAVAWAALIGVFGSEILTVVYDGKFDDLAGYLWLVGLLPLAAVVANVAMAVLRAQERPEAVFAARAAASGTAATVGAGLTFSLGIAGALLSDLVTVLVEAAVMVGLVRRGPETPPTSGGLGSAGLGEPGGDGAEPEPRPHLLLVSFACGPGRGSEPGHGWHLVKGTAERYDVTAIVYSGFRAVIERELARRPLPGLRVVYYRLPFEDARHHEGGQDRQGIREQLHYHAWQVGAGRLAKTLERQTPFDLAHHVSFARYWSPSAGAAVDAPFLWGPVGGGESAPEAFYPTFSAAGRRYEAKRDLARAFAHRLPSVRRTARRATLGLASTAESAQAMSSLGCRCVQVAQAGVALAPEVRDALAALPAPGDGPLRFLSVGRLLHWKGFGLGLRAFARALETEDGSLDGAEYWIVGGGPEQDRLAALADELGVAGRVTVWGPQPRDECFRLIGESHVLVHPSFHDSGGYATLEGMAAGRPVVCLALGGPARQVTPQTGVAVPAHTPEQAEADLARAFLRLAADPGLRRSMGAAGRARVDAHFALPAMLDALAGHYRQLWDAGAQTEPAPASARPSQPEVSWT